MSIVQEGPESLFSETILTFQGEYMLFTVNNLVLTSSAVKRPRPPKLFIAAL
jgi:hypothetical protein